MVLDSQVQILLDLQAQHALTVRADWGSHLFSSVHTHWQTRQASDCSSVLMHQDWCLRSGASSTGASWIPSKDTRAVRPAITSATSPWGNASCWVHVT